MNLYVRYFDREYLAKTVDEALEFLQTIEEIKLESNAASRINTFLSSSNLYPFRLKVSFSNYVLFLKTEADTIEQFKEEEAKRKEQKADRVTTMAERKKNILDALNEEFVGWWDTALTFKRVITMPDTGKCKYIDTRFHVRQRAKSAMDAYNHIIDHLLDRPDVDPRSQFPSAKSDKYEHTFLGEELPEQASEAPAEELAQA
ncbi:MAG: hypothetical protein J5616_06925 [Bacteroidaceae bacterium]|nr:hypothetical protein [Bacteroidaceae bacterium]